MTQSTVAAQPLPRCDRLPLIGNTLQFLNDPATFLGEATKKHGSVFSVRVLADEVACFVGPEAFSFFLNDAYVTRKSGSPPHVQQIFHPDAVPFLSDEQFLRRKGLLMHAFTPGAVDGYLGVVERVVARFAERWVGLGEYTWVPEIASMGMTIVRALFIEADAEREDPEFERLFATATTGILSVPINLPFTGYGRSLKARDRVREVIAEAVARPSQNAKSLMAKLREARTASGEQLSEEELRIELFHFFGAYAAVVGAISFLALYVGRDDALRAALRAELSLLPEGPLTSAGLASLPLLDRVCKEVRRAQPIVPITFFGVIREDCEFEGKRLPKGMKAIGCLAATLSDPATYPAPERFDPDRWKEERVTPKQQQAWVPHGGGAHHTAHRCAGEALANVMMKAFVVKLLRQYDWRLPQQDFSATAGGLFATPKSGLRATLQRLG